MLCAPVFLAGCDSLTLEEEPKTFLSDTQFFNTKADADAAMAAVYQVFRGLYTREYPLMLELWADYADGRGSYAAAGNYECDQQCLTRLNGIWSNFYRQINRANLVIDRVPNITMNAAKKEQLIAEAQFLRAWDYYNLVRYWGAVPLKIKPAEGLTSLAAPRAAVSEVYDQIISDLIAAEAKLPDSYPAAQQGRATKWAAKILLSDVYLARENWAQAAAKALEVIQSNRFSLVRPTKPDEFLDRLYGASVNSAEEIFDIVMLSVPDFGTEMTAAMALAASGYAASAFDAIFGDTKSILADWDTRDFRYTYNLYVGDLARLNTAAEPQHFRKLRDPSATARNAHGNDIPIYRYADALLIFAEADARAKNSPSAEAYTYLNQVRRRAYGVDLNTPDASVDVPAGLGLQAFLDVVILERAYEFMMEGKRYWDLKRTGKIQAAAQRANEPFDDRDMLWPLPTEELDANEALTTADQNPGW